LTLSFKTGQFQGGTGNVAVTGVGFQPKLVMLYESGYFVGFDTIDSWSQFGLGAASDTTATNQRSMYMDASDGATPTDAACVWDNDAATHSNRNKNICTVSAIGADGFTTNWSANTDNSRMYYACLGGADITNVKVGNITSPTSGTTGNQSYTGIGFQPDLLILFGSHATASGTVTSGATYCVGFATSATGQVSISGVIKDAVTTTSTQRYQRSNNAVCYALMDIATTTTKALEGALVSMNADGFTINWTTVGTNGASKPVNYIAIKGGSYKVGAISSPTAGTAPVSQATTGAGFRPKGLFMCSAGAVSSTAIQAGQQISFGAGSSSTDRHCCFCGENDSTTSSVTMNINKSAKLVSMYNIVAAQASSTVNAEADITTLDADGFTLSWTTKSATVAYECIYLAVGDAAVVVGGAKNLQIAKAYFTSDS
jgi:hypothetical protein